MKLNSLMRYTYSFGWACSVMAVLYRFVERVFPGSIQHMPVTARGMLFFGGLLFVSTIATGIYIQVLKGEHSPVVEMRTKDSAA